MLLPLDPVEDLYVLDFFSGGADPEPDILRSSVPLVLYALDGPQRLRLFKEGEWIRMAF